MGHRPYAQRLHFQQNSPCPSPTSHLRPPPTTYRIQQTANRCRHRAQPNSWHPRIQAPAMSEPCGPRDRQILRRIQSGDTYSTIASDLGITRQRVHQIAKRHGLTGTRPKTKPLTPTEQETAHLLEHEPLLSYREVAEQTGQTVEVVYRVARTAGLLWMRQRLHQRGIQAWDYEIDPTTGCWVWQHSKTTDGHGQVNMDNRSVTYAHRMAYEQFRGPIPHGAWVMHDCRNNSCINPDHLRLNAETDPHERWRQIAIATGRLPAPSTSSRRYDTT